MLPVAAYSLRYCRGWPGDCWDPELARLNVRSAGDENRRRLERPKIAHGHGLIIARPEFSALLALHCFTVRPTRLPNVLSLSRHVPTRARGATQRVAPDEPRKRRAHERHVVGCCEELAGCRFSEVLACSHANVTDYNWQRHKQPKITAIHSPKLGNEKQPNCRDRKTYQAKEDCSREAAERESRDDSEPECHNTVDAREVYGCRPLK